MHMYLFKGNLVLPTTEKISSREISWKSKNREIRENLFPRKFRPLRYDRNVVELNHSGAFQTGKFQRIAKFAKFCAREIWRKSLIREIRENKFIVLFIRYACNNDITSVCKSEDDTISVQSSLYTIAYLLMENKFSRNISKRRSRK